MRMRGLSNLLSVIEPGSDGPRTQTMHAGGLAFMLKVVTFLFQGELGLTMNFKNHDGCVYFSYSSVNL